MSVKSIFAASALAASSLVSAVAIPQLQTASSEQSCVGKPSNYKFVTRLPSNVQYEVVCGADYYGSDLQEGGIQWPGSFEGCLAACEANDKCKAVSWADGPCYLKGGVTGLSNNDNVWTARKNPAPTCEGETNSNGATYLTSAGKFEIICAADYGGGDLDYNSRFDTFAECIDYCAADDQCIDVSFVHGACYPKKALNALLPNGSVWTAKLLGSRAGAVASSSPVTTSTPTPTPEAPKALTCSGEHNDDGRDYKKFKIQCGNDHAGGDIGAYPSTTTFEECMDACEDNGECVAISWVWGTCYMKNAANPGATGVGHVWGAVRPSRDAVVPSPTPEATVDNSTIPAAAPSPVAVESITPEVVPTATPALVNSTAPASTSEAVPPPIFVNSTMPSNTTAPIEPTSTTVSIESSVHSWNATAPFINSIEIVRK